MGKGKVCEELVGLSGPFTKIARAMSRQWNVRIVPTGAKCSTDGETISIPFTADYLPLEMRQVLHGHLDHEVCHVAEERRHKEAGRVSPIVLFNQEKNKTIAGLINVFEDIRIEVRYSAIYKGVGENLNASNIRSAEQWEKCHQDNNFWHAFGSAIILRARGQKCAWTHKGKIAEYLELCDEEIQSSTDPKHEWVDAAIDLANRVYVKVKDEYDKDDDDKGSKGKSDPGDDEDDGGEGDDSQGDSAPADDTMTPGDEGRITDFNDLSKEQMAKDVHSDADKFHRYIPHPKAVRLDTVRDAHGDAGAFYAKAKSEVQPQIAAMRGKQRALVMSWQRRRLRIGLDSGFIDEDALSEVATGNRRVFSDYTKRRALNTAISILVDCSGSMGHNEESELSGLRCSAYYASRATIALVETWVALNVSTEVLGFTVDDQMRTGIVDEELEGPYFCRPPLRHVVFKGFDEGLKACRGRFEAIRGHHSNVDGEAVLWAARRLAARPDRRKILVVVSDGQPATTTGQGGFLNMKVANSATMERHLREVITQVTGSGIEVIGIGAGTDVPGRFYNANTGAKFVPVLDINTMAVDVFRVMKTKLTKGMAA